MFAFDLLRQRAEPRIGDLPALSKVLAVQVAIQSAREDIGEIVIGGFIRRVVTGMRNIKFSEHRS